MAIQCCSFVTIKIVLFNNEHKFLGKQKPSHDKVSEAFSEEENM